MKLFKKKDPILDPIIKRNMKKRSFYNEYGKVLRIQPLSLLKKAFWFDVIAPLTFGIPTILAVILVLFTLGKTITWVIQE